ncbi:TPA: hypothetical protein ACGOWV_000546 [Streptococcus suis]
MKIKNRLGDADADRTDVHQIKSTTSAFDFRRVLLFNILPFLNSDRQTSSPEANAVQKAIYLYRKPLLWFLFAGFTLTFSIGFFTGKIQPLQAGFWGMLAILLFVGQLKK